MAKIEFLSDIGKQRTKNEDSIIVMPESKVYVAADGVGGHNSGELASRSAISMIEKFISSIPIETVHLNDNIEDSLLNYFARCFNEINNKIFDMSMTNQEHFGMATTVVLGHIFNGQLYIINVGDSRAYIIREGEIRQITVDHTYVNQLVESGEITREEARIHPRKNEITKALGAASNIKIDFFSLKLCKDDIIILCTDGLTGELTDEEICEIVLYNKESNNVCQKLIDKANKNGGKDNISVICIKLCEEDIANE